jgi:hypothetical protein
MGQQISAGERGKGKRNEKKGMGLNRDLNPGPRPFQDNSYYPDNKPEGRIIPLDH